MINREAITNLSALIEAAHTPRAAADYIGSRLEKSGFARLELGKAWEILPGGNYFVCCHDSALAAFSVGKTHGMLRIAAAHLDSPCLKIKPSPEQTRAGVVRLNIEGVGGMINSSWLDRVLGISGVVCVRGSDPFEPKMLPVDIPHAAVIPNLAIHMNREVNKGVEINLFRDMMPMLAEQSEQSDILKGYIADALGIASEEILGMELSLYNDEAPRVVGLNGEFYCAPRIDNLSSASACVDALIKAKRDEGINLIMLYDHEEVGSMSMQGAAGAITRTIIEKLLRALGEAESAIADALSNGMLLSLDVAHAVHPNHPELADPSCSAVLGSGLAVKMNYTQRYPTDSRSVAIIRALCEKHNIPCQYFMNRADLAGGSTIGAFASSSLGMPAVDAGVPILAMHSSLETMAAADMEALCRLAEAFFE